MPTQENTVNWPTADGTMYSFISYTQDTTWNSVGGVYIFAYFHDKLWRAVYIGETEDFSQRLPNHERWSEAKKKGATHIHARVEKQAATREALERKLIQHLEPPLNEQHR